MKDIEKELEGFAEDKIKEIFSKNKGKGFITYGEISEELANMDLTPEQMDAVYDVLGKEDFDLSSVDDDFDPMLDDDLDDAADVAEAEEAALEDD